MGEKKINSIADVKSSPLVFILFFSLEFLIGFIKFKHMALSFQLLISSFIAVYEVMDGYSAM